MVLFQRDFLQMGDRLRQDYTQMLWHKHEDTTKNKNEEDAARINMDDNDDRDHLASYFMDAAAERKFSNILWDLFDKDFEREDTDRRIPEEADSLMDDDRTFLLNCLTGSPSFAHLHRKVLEMRKLLGREKTDFPDRRVYIWLTHILHWISCLQKASKDDSVIRKHDARQLITAGERVFSNISDSVQKLFGKHLVHVSAKNKQNQIGVWSREGGAHNSPGILCLRWCVLLLEALKNDYELLLHWEQEQKRVQDLVHSIIARGPAPQDPNTIHQLTACEQQLWRLLHEEQDMVVRSSRSRSELYDEVKNYLNKFSTEELKMDFASKEYGNDNAVGPYREQLLDALLVRVEAHGYPGLSFYNLDRGDNATASTNCSWRHKIRSRFFQAFWKRSEVMPDDLRDDMLSMCLWKAWEVENDLDEMIEDDLEESPLSDSEREEAKKKRYFPTARSLVHSLEDPKSMLSLNVLGGIVPTDTLVRMSPEERANPMIQKEREAAMNSASAQRDLVSDGCLREDNNNNDNSPKKPEKKPVPQDRSEESRPTDEDIFYGKVRKTAPPLSLLVPKGSPLQHETKAPSESTTQPPVQPSAPKTSNMKRRGSDSSVSESEKPPAKVQKFSVKQLLSKMSFSPETESPPQTSEASVSVKSPSNAASLNVQQILSKLPVKPPPVAPALPRDGPLSNNQVPKPPIEKPRAKTPGNLIQNKAGTKFFQFTFSKTYDVDFQAFLDKVEDGDSVANNYLPSDMHCSAGCTIEQTEEFLSGKLKNPRYSYYILRVKLEGSQEKQYKKFYKKHETIRKIAYYKFGEKEKAFLITPKFHRCVRSLAFPRSDSSYLVGIKAKDPVVVSLLD